MKILPTLLGLVALLVSPSLNSAKASPMTNPPPVRLTVELRDSSRVIGQNANETIKFQSPLLGHLKLAVKDLRAVECPDTNAAKLTTANGDTLVVVFSDPQLSLKTDFGKIELAVASIRKITVSTAGPATRRPGLVALWSGEDNGKDSIGNHDAELTDIAYADGKVGRAFLFDGENATIKVSANPALNVGLGSGFTLGVWINPSDVSKNNPLFEWVEEGVRCGTQFYIYPPDGGPGTLYALIGDTEGGAHYFFSAPGTVMPNTFQFVALTYDKASGLGKIYCNGTLVAQQDLGSFTPQTSCNLYLGKRPLIGGESYQFTGLFDEAAIYDRALSASEIREICTADNHGETLPAPRARFPKTTPFRQ
jgi:hypothetical protein